MWSKTLVALTLGCLLSISIMLNLNYLLVMAVDERLLIGLLAAFPVWLVAMMLVYCAPTILHAIGRCLLPLLISAAINLFYVLG